MSGGATAESGGGSRWRCRTSRIAWRCFNKGSSQNARVRGRAWATVACGTRQWLRSGAGVLDRVAEIPQSVHGNSQQRRRCVPHKIAGFHLGCARERDKFVVGLKLTTSLVRRYVRQRVDEVVASQSRGSVSAYQIDSDELVIVREGSTCRAGKAELKLL